MSRTGIISPYLTLRYVVRSGFPNIYPTFCRDRPRTTSELPAKDDQSKTRIFEPFFTTKEVGKPPTLA